MKRRRLRTHFPNNTGLLLCSLMLLFFIASPFVSLAQAPTTLAASKYQSNYSTIKQLGDDLYQALKPSYQAQVSPHPLWYNDDLRPYIRPFEFENDKNTLRIVYVSEGFIRLVNGIAHAKAIDKIEPGFFSKYIRLLSEQTGGQVVPELPDLSNPRYWTDDVINEQLSYFNQIVGVLAAIELAHHYLGHEEKYADLLHDSASNPVTMATCCTPAEWDQALKIGAANALDCGYAFEGVKAFYDCIMAMERRPGWTFYFLPLKVRVDNLAKTKKTLDDMEKTFFGQR